MGIFDNVRKAKAAFKAQQEKAYQAKLQRIRFKRAKAIKEQQLLQEKSGYQAVKKANAQYKAESRKNSVLGRIAERAKQNQNSGGFGAQSNFGSSPFTSGFGPNPFQQQAQKAGSTNKKDVKKAKSDVNKGIKRIKLEFE